MKAFFIALTLAILGTVAIFAVAVIPRWINSLQTTSQTTTTKISESKLPEGGIVFVGAGDIAACDSTNDEATAALLDKIDSTVFTLGDNVYDVADTKTLEKCYGPNWGRHKNRTRPSFGNHDGPNRGQNLTDSLAYFSGQTEGSKTGYYSYNLGDWHMVVLNANLCSGYSCSVGGEQYEWLLKDLKANPTKCTLAYWHNPRFSSGIIHGSSTKTENFWQALYENGADVVLQGHEHNYERFAPLNPKGEVDVEKGIRSFIVGTGGRGGVGGGYSFGTPITGSEVRKDGVPGVLKMTLFADEYYWEFLPIAGQTFTDSGNAKCH